MHAELKKDDASLENKSSDRHRESRSYVNRNSDLLSGESTEGFTSSPSQTLQPTGQGQLVMQCKGLSNMLLQLNSATATGRSVAKLLLCSLIRSISCIVSAVI
jgi:hypothetical protein